MCQKPNNLKIYIYFYLLDSQKIYFIFTQSRNASTTTKNRKFLSSKHDHKIRNWPLSSAVHNFNSNKQQLFSFYMKLDENRIHTRNLENVELQSHIQAYSHKRLRQQYDKCTKSCNEFFTHVILPI